MIDQNWIYLGAALNLVGTGMYIRDVLNGTAKPNRVTWAILGFAPMLAFGAMITQGVGFRQSLMTFVVGLSPLLVIISTFFTKHPAWKIQRFDLYCGGLSLVGLLLWLITKEGNAAITFAILADGLAFLPTLVKGYKYPESESKWLFLLGFVNGLIAVLIIQHWDYAHGAFPVYLLTVDAIAVLFIWFKLGPKIRSLHAKRPT
ncbi:MAG: hypothetical protein WAQ24_00885 [Candidatus Saccharimonadales bacterium]